MNLDTVFEKLLAGDTVQYSSSPESGLPPVASMRTMLARKLRFYKETMDKYGFLPESITNSGISCKKFDGYVEFRLNSQKRVRVDYQILNMEEGHGPETEDVPGNLVTGSNSTPWYPSGSALPQASSAACDSSSTQGENSELRNDAQDWGTYFRTAPG